MVFRRKDPCEARPKMQSVFQFSDALFVLRQMDPPIDEALGQVGMFVTSLDQADLWSDVLRICVLILTCRNLFKSSILLPSFASWLFSIFSDLD